MGGEGRERGDKKGWGEVEEEDEEDEEGWQKFNKQKGNEKATNSLKGKRKRITQRPGNISPIFSTFSQHFL